MLTPAAGSRADSKCWKNSVIGREWYSVIPHGTHFIGDAGYALLPGPLVPYCEREERGVLSSQEKQYIFLHSSTRMVVESRVAKWKGRFRMVFGSSQPGDTSQRGRVCGGYSCTAQPHDILLRCHQYSDLHGRQ
ncbi:hypothetical protein JG688_00018579 [Phytophthora aleatoria]|uniref:DDE Tnp4 domain-containing protein n=1 Tax=Phytophthora aleatoria TaxID=2496075 RepID=A0A8J5LUM3_9STRA|nr:hypothetical protein JG688_00018579 [Phytophthora aleatoria]